MRTLGLTRGQSVGTLGPEEAALGLGEKWGTWAGSQKESECWEPKGSSGMGGPQGRNDTEEMRARRGSKAAEALEDGPVGDKTSRIAASEGPETGDPRVLGLRIGWMVVWATSSLVPTDT